MNYTVETRILDDKRYAVARKVTTAPKESYIEHKDYSVIIDAFDYWGQVVDFCEALLKGKVVETAILISEQSNDGNDNGDSRQD